MPADEVVRTLELFVAVSFQYRWFLTQRALYTTHIGHWAAPDKAISVQHNVPCRRRTTELALTVLHSLCRLERLKSTPFDQLAQCRLALGNWRRIEIELFIICWHSFAISRTCVCVCVQRTNSRDVVCDIRADTQKCRLTDCAGSQRWSRRIVGQDWTESRGSSRQQENELVYRVDRAGTERIERGKRSSVDQRLPSYCRAVEKKR